MIEKRNGRWRARLRLEGHPQTSKTFATESAARKWHQQIEDAAKLGTLADVLAAEQTFAQMLRDYAERITPTKRGAAQELSRIGQLERSTLADLRLSSISRPVLRAFRDRSLKSVKGSSWNRTLSLVTQVLAFAVREHDAKLDVRALVEGLRGQESPGRTGRISPADEAALLAAAPKVAPWAAAMIRLALALGVRRGELHSLRHGAVDRQAMSIHVAGTKTAASVRTLPISAATLAIIDGLPRSLTDDRLFWQAGAAEDITYAFRRCCYHAKLPHLTLHLCRHECLSRLAEAGAGADLLKLRAYSGHATLSMLGRYARPAAESLRQMVA
jgi:integrase